MKRNIVVLIIAFISCQILTGRSPSMESFVCTSPSFKHKGGIPKKFTCEGENISPALEWKNAPKNTQSFALIVDDPDAPAGTWVHWVVFNIPGTQTHIPEGQLPKGAQQGTTSFKKQEYGGPCPPVGHGIHHYHFKLYALKTKLTVDDGADKSMVEKAMQGNILAQTELVGTYERKK